MLYITIKKFGIGKIKKVLKSLLVLMWAVFI